MNIEATLVRETICGGGRPYAKIVALIAKY